MVEVKIGRSENPVVTKIGSADHADLAGIVAGAIDPLLVHQHLTRVAQDTQDALFWADDEANVPIAPSGMVKQRTHGLVIFSLPCGVGVRLDLRI